MTGPAEAPASRRVLLWLFVGFLCAAAAAAGQEPASEAAAQEQEAVSDSQAEEEADEPFVHTHSETVVVTASRIEQELVNAPATVTVIRQAELETAGSSNVGDLIRRVPGVNVVQLSNRDYNVTSRSAGGTLASTQLVLVDGRSVYQDFYGFVAWDLIPNSLRDIERLEVLRGPASAVWGANAMNGVVNLITKSPRDSVGTSVDFEYGFFDRNVQGRDMDAGQQFSVTATHAAAPTDRFAYKASIGFTQQDGFARPFGEVPNDTGTPYPPFEPLETRLPKVNLRFDFEPDDSTRIKVTGGYAGTQGMLHTGIGPFRLHDGARMSFGRVQYERDSIEVSAFVNATNADMDVLLVTDSNGVGITSSIAAYTYDVSFRDTRFLANRHLISYGANARLTTMDFGLAPLGDRRDEQGVYLQDEIFFTDRFRWIIGSRADRMSVLGNFVLSPRTTLLFKPTPSHAFRASYNRAFRAPSLIQNFLQIDVGQPATFDLRPAFRGLFGAIQIPDSALPAPVDYLVPFTAEGNPDLTEETLTAWELGYSGDIGHRLGVSAAVYVNDITDTMDFTDTEFWASANPPRGWNEAFAEVGDFVGALVDALPPGTVPESFAAVGESPAALIDLLGPLADVRLPSLLTYVNREFIRNVGVELGLDASISRNVGGFVNYSWQKEPEVRGWTENEVNIAPSHRVNAGLNLSTDLVQAGATVNYTGRGFWADVLTAEYHGWTEAFTMVSGSIGFRLFDGRVNPQVKVVNLLNQDIQQHIFGDILKRQVIGQVRFQF